VPRDAWTAPKRKKSKRHATLGRGNQIPTCALGLPKCPIPGRPRAKWRCAWRPGLPPVPMPGRPSARGSSSKGLASRLTPLPSSPTSLLLNSVVYSDSQYIHNAAQCTSFIMNSFTINSILCYIEILISFSYN
jgi:hypothetical protein